MKLKGATIIESLIAMVILVSIMGISSMIYVQVFNSGNQAVKLKAATLAREEIRKLKAERRFIDSETHVGDLILHTFFTQYQENTHLLDMRIRVDDKEGKLYYESHELFIDQ